MVVNSDITHHCFWVQTPLQIQKQITDSANIHSRCAVVPQKNHDPMIMISNPMLVPGHCEILKAVL